MAEELHELPRVEQRLGATEAVQQVMRAVWALARAQQPQVEAAAGDATAYLDAAEAVVVRLAGDPMIEQAPEHVLWVLVGPERPFCGPLARMLLEQLPPRGPIGLVGQRLAEACSQLPALQERVVFQLHAATTPQELGHRAELLAAELLAAERPSAVLLHPVDGLPRLHRSVVLAGARGPIEAPPETLLPVGEVLEAAVLEVVAGRLAVALAEALRAEVRARLTAAEAAYRATERQLEALRHRWRVLRQDAITQELLELTAGRRSRR